MQALDRIGPYTLLRPLGEGARSAVWLASEAGSGRERALKLLRTPDQAGRARFRNEWAVARQLAPHPHVARIDAAGEAGGVPWLAMELLGAAPPLSLAGVRQLLLALGHVHAHGIVHCDVKQANLLAGPDGALKLADFGIARQAGQGAGPAHGTPHAMAPEQLRGQPLDCRVDIFAAGVLLYQLVTGARPFAGSPFEVMQQILGGLAHDPGTPFDAVLARALAADPACRYAHAAEFLSAFDAACQSV